MPQQITDFSSPFLFDEKVKKKTLKKRFCTLATKPPRYTTPHTHGTFISDKLEDVFKTDNNSVKLVDITRHQLLNILVTSDGVIRERSESALFDIKCIFKWSCTRIPTLLLHKNVVIPRLITARRVELRKTLGRCFVELHYGSFLGSPVILWMTITKFYGKPGPKHRLSLRQEHPQIALNIVILTRSLGAKSKLLAFKRDL